ncbi:MAG: pseudoazurin [Geminicoccaceae bacterium]
MRSFILAAVATGVTLFGAAQASAETFEVEMLNQGPDGTRNVFAPALLEIEPGDTVRFVAVDKGHNAAAIDGAIPAGAEAFEGKINETFEVTLTEPGIYAYKCTPHLGLGMVGVIVVGGDTSNLSAVEDQRYVGKARQVMADLLAKVADS